MPATMSTTPHRGYEIPNANPDDLVPQIQAMLADIDNDVNTITGGAGAALADPGSNGIVVRTSTSVTVARTLTGPAAGLTISNGSGVSGNPTFALANDLAALEALSTTGFAKRTGTDTWTAAALVSGDIPDLSATYQPLDGDLSAIAALSGTAGLARKTAANTWSLDTNIYLTANQTITLSGDVSGSGATAITTTIGALKVLNSMIANATIDLTAKVTGILPSANGGTGVSNAGTITNASNTTITGGGTLALGGFTLTVPATGTAVLTSRTITEGNGLAGNTYDLSANRTLALGTPSTLTVATSNSASGTTHSHAITSSSNPGAAASLLATDSSGYLTTVRHTVTDYLFVNNATANLYLKDTSTGFQAASSTVITPQASNSVRSTSFTSGLVGWGINAVGDAEFNNITTRGELRASVFNIGEISATAGTLGVFYSAGTLLSDITIPSVILDPFNMDVKNSDDGGMLFAVGDVIRIKAYSNSNSVIIADTWATVGTRTNHTTYATYACALRAGSTGVTFRAGTAIIDYGTSSGGVGFITISADGTVGASPNLTMAKTDTTSPWGNAPVLLTRLGNLNGSYGYATDVYGFGAGSYGVSGQPWLTVETTNGIRIGNNTTVLGQWDTSGNIVVGQVASSQSNVRISSGAVDLRNNTTSRIHLASDGSGYLANSLIAWDTSGNLTVTGNAVIGGVTIGSGKMYVGTGTFNNTNTGFYVDSTGQFSLKDKLSWDGTTLSINGGGTFSGALSAASGTFAGSLTAASGAITGTLTMSGSGSAIAIGSTPPTSASAGTGIWLDRTGMYGLLSNVVQAKFDATTGTITAGNGNIVLDSTALKLKGAGAINFYDGSNNFVGSLNGNSAVVRLQSQGLVTGDGAAHSGLAATNGVSGAQGTLDVTADSSSNVWASLSKSAGGTLGLIIGATTIPNAMLDVRGDIFSTGSLGATGSRLVKGWFTDLQVTNAISGSVTGNAATVTTNANLTGPITSSGNATSIASQTGTGTTFVMSAGPTFTGTPTINSGATNENAIFNSTASTGPYQTWNSSGTTKGYIGYDNGALTTGGSGSGAMTFRSEGSIRLSIGATTRVTVANDGGVTVGAPSGGSQGAGSINAVTVWRNGTSLDSVFEPDYKLLSIDAMGEFVKANHHLPTIPTNEVNVNGSTNLGALEDRLWETTENHALYILQLNDRIKSLEAKIVYLEEAKKSAH